MIHVPWRCSGAGDNLRLRRNDVPWAAQFVKTVTQKYAGQFQEVAKAIVESHYKDDYFDSTMETVEKAVIVGQGNEVRPFQRWVRDPELGVRLGQISGRHR